MAGRQRRQTRRHGGARGEEPAGRGQGGHCRRGRRRVINAAPAEGAGGMDPPVAAVEGAEGKGAQEEATTNGTGECVRLWRGHRRRTRHSRGEPGRWRGAGRGRCSSSGRSRCRLCRRPAERRRAWRAGGGRGRGRGEGPGGRRGAPMQICHVLPIVHVRLHAAGVNAMLPQLFDIHTILWCIEKDSRTKRREKKTKRVTAWGQSSDTRRNTKTPRQKLHQNDHCGSPMERQRNLQNILETPVTRAFEETASCPCPAWPVINVPNTCTTKTTTTKTAAPFTR